MNITYLQLTEDADSLAKMLPKNKYNYVFGIPTGGIIPAYIISKELKAPMLSIKDFTEGNFTKDAEVLIVDDLIDGGTTLKKFNPEKKYEVAVVYRKEHSPKDLTTYFYREMPNEWLSFPHEKDSTGIEEHIERILEYVGEDINREGLLDTPKRVAKMYGEIFGGYKKENKPKITTFLNGQDGIVYDQMILDEGDFYSHCLTGDSQVKTTKGTFRIKNLVGKKENVFCYDEKNKRFTISEATNIRKTRKNAEVWKLTTDYNVIYATPDHKFFTYNRGWVQLKDLQPKDSLVALNTRLYDNYLNIQIENTKDGWKKEHKFIYEEVNKVKLKKEEIVHHIDYDKRNNSENNLKKLTSKKYNSLHAIAFQNSLSLEERSENGKRANRGFQNLEKSNPTKYKEVKKRANESMKQFYKTEKGISLRVEKSRFMKKEWAKRHRMKNHKVVKVEYYGKEDVYCMEVKKYKNFVANSLVVHNCEHHMVPFFGKYYFAYIPNPKGKIIGLSKVARIVDYYSAKLQIQERLVQDIVNELWNALDIPGCSPRGMALVMRGEHLCKTMRGAKKKGRMTTAELRGIFKEDDKARNEFYKLISI